MSDRHQQSVNEGARLAHLYDGRSDIGAVDKQVHDALLQDFIKAHHSEIEMDTVLSSMKKESEKSHNVQLKTDSSTSMVRESNFMGINFDAAKLFDVCEGVKAYEADDKKREQAANPENKEKQSPLEVVFKDIFGLVSNLEMAAEAASKK